MARQELRPPENRPSGSGTPASRAQRVRQGRQRLSQHGLAALLAMLVPAVLFPLCLFLVRGHPRFTWIHDVRTFPWEFWGIAVCGSCATVGGFCDWFFHRSGETTVGRREHQAHVAALAGGGIPLFVLMALASLADWPHLFLLPVLVVLIITVILICYDEFVFHRRCGRWETFTHRLLTIGNGLAFLSWVHWCFVRGGFHG
jgi:hypothetical protein